MSAVLLFFAIVALYGVIPTIVIRRMGLKIYKKGRKTGAVALTFDDGPDPRYTPRLLDLLKKHGVKATFFLVGQKAEQHRDIIVRMHEEGHEIGLHNYRHVSNWFVLPPFLQRGLHRSADIIEKATGRRPVYYRPPWGHFNLWTWPVQMKYKTVMWTHILGDWKERLGVQKLLARLKNSLTDGAIIVLHDSGETLGADEKAPENMLRALELLFQEEEARKMQWVTISEMLNVHNKKQNLL